MHTYTHHGLKGLLLEVGGRYQPRISADGCEHPTRTPSQQHQGKYPTPPCPGLREGLGMPRLTQEP